MKVPLASVQRLVPPYSVERVFTVYGVQLTNRVRVVVALLR